MSSCHEVPQPSIIAHESLPSNIDVRFDSSKGVFKMERIYVSAAVVYSSPFLCSAMKLTVVLTSVLVLLGQLGLVAANRVLVHHHDEATELVSDVTKSSRAPWQDDLEDLLWEASDMIKTAIQKLKKGDRNAKQLVKKWFGDEASRDAGAKKELLRVMKSTSHVLNNFKA
eukprot:4483391-Amphidinium_carterae.1